MRGETDLIEVLARTAEITSTAEKIQDIQSSINSSIELLGFDTCNLAVNKPSGRDFMTDPTLTSWSQADLLRYDADNWADRDPLLAHAVNRSAPLLWRVEDWKNWGHDEYHEYLNANKIRGGLTLPLGKQRGLVSGMTFLTFQDKRHHPLTKQTAYVLSALIAARAVAIGAAARANDAPLKLKYLSGTQLEVLKWISAGKTNSEIALILGMQVRTVAYHVSEVLRKLSVNNRAQAAVIYTAR